MVEPRRLELLTFSLRMRRSEHACLAKTLHPSSVSICLHVRLTPLLQSGRRADYGMFFNQARGFLKITYNLARFRRGVRSLTDVTQKHVWRVSGLVNGVIMRLSAWC